MGLLVLLALASCQQLHALNPFASTPRGSIGASLTQQKSSGRVTVQKVEPYADGHPTELHEGDEILAVEGQDVRDMSVDEIHHAMRGPVGTTVVLQVLRDGKVVRIEMARRALRTPKPGDPAPAGSGESGVRLKRDE